jgi:hypothetical protein
LVHEGGWDIRGKPDSTLVFVRPDGRDYEVVRPGLRDDIRHRIVGRASESGVPRALDLCLDAAGMS